MENSKVVSERTNPVGNRNEYPIFVKQAYFMNIANPIYDTVFKQLMSNMHIARFFIETNY
jgi:hypothetical protein